MFSPDGRHVATAVDHRLVVRDAETLAVVSMSNCVDTIQHVAWSRDNDHVMAACYKRGVVQLFSVSDDGWTCKIDEGPAGCAHARWSPSGAQVVTVADFGVRLSVWSLLDSSCIYVKAPKFEDGRGLDFSPDGRFLAMAERKGCKDAISVVDCESWVVASRFETATNDLQDAKWSPDSTSLAVRDSALDNALYLYSPDGRMLHRYAPNNQPRAMGFKRLEWSQGGTLLAAGGYDERCRVLNHVTWKAFAELPHPSRVVAPATVAVYEEVEEVVADRGSSNLADRARVAGAGDIGQDAGGESSWWEDVWDGNDDGVRDKDPVAAAARRRADIAGGRITARYVVRELPATLPGVKTDLFASEPKVGVNLSEWSVDDRFLATKNDAQPNVAWVWDMSTLELCAVLVQMEPVREMKWDPRAHRLVIVTGSERVYVWTPEGASFVQIPLPEFRARTVSWNPYGGEFALGDKGTFCCAFMGES